MTDVLLFLRYGWQNIWKQKTIWLFSALVFLMPFLPKPPSPPKSISLGLLSILYSIFAFLVRFYSTIGVPYLAYCFSIGRSVTIQETFFAIRRFSWRVAGCSCLSLIIFSPAL